MFETINDKKPEAILPTLSAHQPQEDEDYLYRRAEQQLELAQAATHPAVVKAHYLLADAYLERLHAPAGEVEDEAA